VNSIAMMWPWVLTVPLLLVASLASPSSATIGHGWLCPHPTQGLLVRERIPEPTSLVAAGRIAFSGDPPVEPTGRIVCPPTFSSILPFPFAWSDLSDLALTAVRTIFLSRLVVIARRPPNAIALEFFWK
jgi:hypothetical protein